MDLNNEPIEYVRRFTEFLGCRIDLSKKPLIPRPETEFWVQRALEEIDEEFNSVKKTRSRLFHRVLKLRVLDIFSGSGCIGLAVLRNIKNAKVVFADSDPRCIEQIKINLRLNNISKNIPKKPASYKFHGRENCETAFKVVSSDVFGNIKGKFDYIFANPPYIPFKNKNLVQKSVLEYEPRNALFAGQNGLFYIKKFLKQAPAHLSAGGRIFMEFSPEQKKEIEKIFKNFIYSKFEFYKDQYGKWRWAVIG